MTMCETCVLEEGNGVTLNSDDICNYCEWQWEMEEKFPIRRHGDLFMMNRLKTKKPPKSNAYDCIIGISGGIDSSYLLAKSVISWGLKPLAVTFDDGWNTKTSQANIRKLIDELNVNLYTYVVDYEEMNDIYRSFILAGVQDTDAPTDVAIAKVLRLAAKKYKVKTILDAHNFRTEGTTPLGWLYFDGAYIRSVHDQFGRFAWSEVGDNTGGFPNLTMEDMIWDKTIKARPLYVMKYSRESAIEYLKKAVGYEEYNLHHGENIWTKFSNYVWMPEKFGLDLRSVFLSAQVRSRIISREDAIEKLSEPPISTSERDRLVQEVSNRLEIDVEHEIKSGKKRTYEDFKTYKNDFRRMKPIFWILNELGLVNETFYRKYCAGI